MVGVAVAPGVDVVMGVGVAAGTGVLVGSAVGTAVGVFATAVGVGVTTTVETLQACGDKS